MHSLLMGSPALEIEEKETIETAEYQEICCIDVPEGFYLSLEEVSIVPQTNPDKALFYLEMGDLKKDKVKLPTTLTLPFRGRAKIPAGQRVWIGIKSSDGTSVKGNGAILGILVGVSE